MLLLLNAAMPAEGKLRITGFHTSCTVGGSDTTDKLPALYSSLEYATGGI